ncbi:MAG TPA: 23S rRNA (adenine(2030)-N(6))-methyltransferase RlmJ [Accumulibacter sp.]|uniref:23S rRNA (adenine(2030)-N(6))-methyltransferase RlmJ n=1 Tax=Accumulibacter sp. TaxID=2053492 RepID=UPI0025E72772|nr:23S rRNA (adenine(2030)-N(6))-methyltransferase RlmJ [Accumulibacter sp.]MCM8600013.1 23S rRNA (adenine(2030)-N(6))-methyltransferase RlmJ [Accumulibacter sp.]MCM8664200.1 23S rRNA (adenine(2030)-N(6))-methyltransferase RlmJ [Accumulibacter sp.]HNC53157.1 23S rRNA (adenine(2030)-N(6))-methyltransferase RlmJ [Accumulibacter sp.]
MLSYRHAFHAGNHADVFKHVVLVQLTRYLGQKDKAFWYIDTHAGAGSYALDSAQAGKLAEYRDGIGRLWGRADLPPALADYVNLVRGANADGRLHVYPGSPRLALSTMRAQDRLRLYERHSREVLRLRANFRDSGKRVIVEEADGFAALRALLPPPPRRALVLIDPAYEEKGDYDRVVHSLRECLSRFPGGVYLLWYPQLTRREAQALPQRLQRLPSGPWLHVTLRVRTPASDGFGMHGSGLFVVNPPWTLQTTLQEVMPRVVELLGQDAGAGFTLDGQES